MFWLWLGLCFGASIACFIAGKVIGNMGNQADHKFFSTMAYIGTVLFILLWIAGLVEGS